MGNFMGCIMITVAYVYGYAMWKGISLDLTFLGLYHDIVLVSFVVFVLCNSIVVGIINHYEFNIFHVSPNYVYLGKLGDHLMSTQESMLV